MLAHPSVVSSFLFLFTLSFDMNLCSISDAVLAGKPTGRLRFGGRGVFLLVRGQLDTLLIHALGLHPLDQAEEVFVRHCGGVGAGFWRGTPLIIDSRGLALDKHVKEVIAWFLMVSFTHQVPQVVMGNPQAWQVTDINALVVETPTLRARDQIKQLLSLGGSGNSRIDHLVQRVCSTFTTVPVLRIIKMAALVIHAAALEFTKEVEEAVFIRGITAQLWR